MDHLHQLRRAEGRAGTWAQHVYQRRCGAWHVGGTRKKTGRRGSKKW
ncbi:hypothetical protein [Nocardioides sp. R-C-SC26]|nr:hypothetical protein [Nocardioides sp. R-C-SC26]